MTTTIYRTPTWDELIQNKPVEVYYGQGRWIETMNYGEFSLNQLKKMLIKGSEMIRIKVEEPNPTIIY